MAKTVLFLVCPEIQPNSSTICKQLNKERLIIDSYSAFSQGLDYLFNRVSRCHFFLVWASIVVRQRMPVVNHESKVANYIFCGIGQRLNNPRVRISARQEREKMSCRY